MRAAAVIGHGQIGARLVRDLLAAGVPTTVMTRSSAEVPEAARHLIGDAGRHADVAAAAAGAEVIFACFHAPYDARRWAAQLPGLERTVLDVAAESAATVVFPESAYGFAGVLAAEGVLRDDAAPAPVEAKGRVRQELLAARQAHPARAISVLAGDLIGVDAAPATSVVRMMITDPVAVGRRAMIPADPDVAHALTDIADLTAAMRRAGERPEDVLGAGSHRLLIAPSEAPTLREVLARAEQVAGGRRRRPLVLPHAALAAAGLVSRTILEVARLKPLWRRPGTLVASTELLEAGPASPWADSVAAMVRDGRSADGSPQRPGRAGDGASAEA
ncbi:NAD(P)H-binding protein [Nesterenkonia halobia]|uniref:NAD-dependent epimerase/dehydratase family protein n=1 Tax=Nesterenkonia halobia TaxID=37922 RepID=A0ABP6RI51_9MICC